MEDKKNFKVILLECAIKAIKSGYSVNVKNDMFLTSVEVFKDSELICSIQLSGVFSNESTGIKVSIFEAIINSFWK